VLQNLEKFSKKPLLQPPLLVVKVLTDVPYNKKKLGEWRLEWMFFFRCFYCKNAPVHHQVKRIGAYKNLVHWH
jgi:hypothetical protein